MPCRAPSLHFLAFIVPPLQSSQLPYSCAARFSTKKQNLRTIAHTDALGKFCAGRRKLASSQLKEVKNRLALKLAAYLSKQAAPHRIVSFTDFTGLDHHLQFASGSHLVLGGRTDLRRFSSGSGVACSQFTCRVVTFSGWQRNGQSRESLCVCRKGSQAQNESHCDRSQEPVHSYASVNCSHCCG